MRKGGWEGRKGRGVEERRGREEEWRRRREGRNTHLQTHYLQAYSVLL